MKVEIYLGEVLAMTMQMPLTLPPEINILDPLRMYSEPSFLADVFMACASEPLSGSVRQQLAKSYIEINLGINCYFCWGLPYSSMIQAHMLWMDRQAAVGTHPVARASKMTDASRRESPVPSLQYMAEKPKSADSLRVSTGKQLSFSHSVAYGLNFFFAKSNAWSRMASVSSPRVLSSNRYMPSQMWDQSCAKPYFVECRVALILLACLIIDYSQNMDRQGAVYMKFHCLYQKLPQQNLFQSLRKQLQLEMEQLVLPTFLHGILLKRVSSAFTNIVLHEDTSFQVYHIPCYDLQCEAIASIVSILNAKVSKETFNALFAIKDRSFRTKNKARKFSKKTRKSSGLFTRTDTYIKYEPREPNQEAIEAFYPSKHKYSDRHRTQYTDEPYSWGKLLTKIQSINKTYSIGYQNSAEELLNSRHSNGTIIKRKIILDKIRGLEESLQCIETRQIKFEAVEIDTSGHRSTSSFVSTD